MNLRRLTREDLPALNDLWSICYLFESNPEEVRKNLEADPTTPYGYGIFGDDGEMQTAALGNELKMIWDGKPYALCGIGGVVTHPAHRNRGGVRAILTQMLRDMWDAGTIFSGLYPFKFAFYRKFGYEVAGATSETKLPIRELLGFERPTDVAMLRPGDDLNLLMPVFDAFARRYALAILRDPKQLADMLKPNPIAGNVFLYAIRENGAPVAYVRFHKEEQAVGGRLLAVDDLAFVAPRHLRLLLGFLGSLESEFAAVKVTLPSDVNLSALVPDPYVVETTLHNRYMMRIVHTEAALKLLKAEGCFTIAVEDEMLPCNGGTWRVSPEGVERTDAAPDLRLSIGAFSQMYCGFTDLRGALLRPDVALLNENPALERAFPLRASFPGMHY